MNTGESRRSYDLDMGNRCLCCIKKLKYPENNKFDINEYSDIIHKTFLVLLFTSSLEGVT